MQLFSWLHQCVTARNHTKCTPARRPARRFRPQLELLEGRDVPSTLTVTNNLGYLDFSARGSLPYEMAVAQSGDTIVFDPSLSGQTISLTQQPGSIGGATQLVINKNLDIEGLGASRLAISANDSRVFEVSSGVHAIIAGLTIENGNGRTGAFDPSWDDGQGGGILNYGTLTLNNCTVSGNHGPLVQDGGGIYNAGTMIINGCTVSGNSAGRAGGGIYNTAMLTVNNSTITGNSAYYEGGGLFNDTNATLALYYSTATGNAALSGADVYSLGTASEFHSVIGVSVGRIKHLK